MSVERYSIRPSLDVRARVEEIFRISILAISVHLFPMPRIFSLYLATISLDGSFPPPGLVGKMRGIDTLKYSMNTLAKISERYVTTLISYPGIIYPVGHVFRAQSTVSFHLSLSPPPLVQRTCYTHYHIARWQPAF